MGFAASIGWIAATGIEKAEGPSGLGEQPGKCRTESKEPETARAAPSGIAGRAREQDWGSPMLRHTKTVAHAFITSTALPTTVYA